MRSFTIMLVLLLANATIILTSSFWIVLIIWLTALLGIARGKFFKVHAIFLVATVIPMFLALLIVWLPAAEKPEIVRVAFAGNVYWYVGFLALRIAAIGGVLQWLLIPVIREKKVESMLRDLRVKPQIVLAVTSTLVLLEDFRRKSRIVIEARIARGLVGKGRLAKWKSFPSTISPLIYTSIISGIQRSDLWAHRDLKLIGYRSVESTSAEFGLLDIFVGLWFISLSTLAIVLTY